MLVYSAELMASTVSGEADTSVWFARGSLGMPMSI